MKIEADSLSNPAYVDTADTLLRWMGMLWTGLSNDPGFVNQYMTAKGLIAAQLTVDMQEAAALTDRNTVPVHHRHRWAPIPLTLRERNTGKAAKLQLGDTYVPVIGPQVSDPFIRGAVAEIGRYYPLKGVTTYPLPDTWDDITTVLVDSLDNPQTVLIRNIDFYVEDSTLFLLHNTDPFESGAFGVTGDGDDRTVLLWAADVTEDRNYISDFIGYVLGVGGTSTAGCRAYLNAVWDLYNNGAAYRIFRAALSALLFIPYILEDTETVEVVQDDMVITDKHVYRIPDAAAIPSTILPGAVLHYGDALTAALRIYDNLMPDKAAVNAPADHTLRNDVPAFMLPSRFFASDIRYGLGLTWAATPVQQSGTDANGNPRLYFDIYGDARDITTFWQYFWDYCERHGIPSSDYFKRYQSAGETAAGYGTIIPFEFFLDNFMKSNTMIIVLDTDMLSDAGYHNAGNLVMLNSIVPANVYIAVLEHHTAGSEEYREYNDAALAADSTAAVDVITPEGITAAGLTYGDCVTVRWVPVCTEELHEH